MIFNHILYIKVFEHNTLLSGFFNDEAEVKSCNKPGKFSILSSMDSYKYGDKYQFMLYYPEIETRNVWRQDKSPCDESIPNGDGSINVSGYEPILIQSGIRYWGGLCLSTNTDGCYIDGSVNHEDWWYAIGAYQRYGTGAKTFPGALDKSVHIVQLWLACDEMHEDIRLNSNIYKRIFPEHAIDMDYIDNIEESVSRNVITQTSHGLVPGQFIFKDNDNLYKLSCADNTATAWVHGIVSEVIDDNTFILQKSGKYPWYDLGWEETTVAYLSDTAPGEIKHYASIKTQIFTPVGIFAGDCLIICPQQPSEGIAIREYDNESWVFESYTGQELLDTIKEVYDYYKGGS